MKTLSLLSIFIIAMVTSISAASEDAMSKGVALDGYCPVCYVAAGKANKGSESFQATHEGKTYYFVSEGTKQMFVAEPNKFLPQYDGNCAYGMALGKKFESDPTVFKVIDGKVYLNKDKSIGMLFVKDEAKFIEQADANWQAMKKKEMMKEKEMMKK